jgi:hypothetical protein
VGVKENLEIGAMFVPMMFGFEGSVKYRFFNENGNHLAVVPYGAFYLFKNYTGGSQMVYTKEFSGGLSLNVAGFGSYTYLDNTSYLSSEVIPSSRYLTVGGVAGPQFSMDAVFFTPSVEYNIFIPLDEEASFNNMQTFRFSIAVGFYIGKSKKQLDRIENKIDGIDKKLDKKQ